MTTRARHGSYLFQRPESRMWWLRLRSPDKAKVHSLKTADKLEAEMLAAPMIAEHKAALLAARPRVELVWRQQYAPGLHDTPDGKIFATERELHYLDAAGATIRTAANGAHEHRIINLQDRLGIPHAPIELDESVAARPSLAVKGADDDLLELYVSHGSVKKQKPLNAARAKEARAIFHTFKTVVGKPLAKCERADGRALVAHLEAGTPGIKSATLHRALVPLVALANVGISEGKLTLNPFIDVVPNRKDSTPVEGFTDADMKLIRANLHTLDKPDQLLLRLLASTGMDRKEAFSIAGERVENGIRYCLIGTKTDARPRRIPFPTALVKHKDFPKKITGKLFTGREDSTSKRITKFLTDIGVMGDGRKLSPLHSFRHRAATRLRQAKVDSELRYAIGGWTDGDKPNSGWNYGHWTVKELREAIDKIGGL